MSEEMRSRPGLIVVRNDATEPACHLPAIAGTTEAPRLPPVRYTRPAGECDQSS